jgi:hypothetical protein
MIIKLSRYQQIMNHFNTIFYLLLGMFFTHQKTFISPFSKPTTPPRTCSPPNGGSVQLELGLAVAGVGNIKECVCLHGHINTHLSSIHG